MKKNITAYALSYGLWILSIGLGLLAAMIVRETVIFALISSEANRYGIHLGTQVITILLGIVLLITIVVLENRYREGLAKRRTFGYFLRFLGIVLLVMAVTHIWYVAVGLSLGPLDLFRFVAALAEVGLGLLSLRLARRRFAR